MRAFHGMPACLAEHSLADQGGLLTLATTVAFAGTVASDADAQGLAWQQLQAQGWTCFPPPVGPALRDRVLRPRSRAPVPG
jgi:hypothetical protein